MIKKGDIESRDDLEKLLRYFYDLMLADELLGPIFTDVAQIDLEAHIPHLVEFWHSILFLTGAYKRNVMEMHIKLDRKTSLEKKHFERWLMFFRQSIDHFFEGPRSTEAYQRAQSIAGLMQVKILQGNKPIH